ncbi:HAD-IA family hydrolase [Haloplanus litoreus]|uniref:HAD-IA family hydrolase n=1 Tax=Haloplanus litoreus TaxID=767515 RepID=UPI0036221077
MAAKTAPVLLPERPDGRVRAVLVDHRTRPRLRARTVRPRPGPGNPERIAEAYDHLESFPGAAETLDRLSADGHEVVVLSNGNPEMLERLAENAGLRAHLDGIVSAHAVRTFKPDPAVYKHAAETLDRLLDDCRLVSANAWDIAGAGNVGMATTWVNRTRDPPESIGARPDSQVSTLPAVADDR